MTPTRARRVLEDVDLSEVCGFPYRRQVLGERPRRDAEPERIRVDRYAVGGPGVTLAEGL